MSRRNLATALLALAIGGVGAVAWYFAFFGGHAVRAERLHELPRTLGAWEGQEVPLDQSVESMLRADANLQRVYRHPTGALAWVYVGYYGTDRGGRPEHTPPTCYTAHGWRVGPARTVALDPERGLRANEMVVEREGTRRLVHFWYRSGERTGLLGGLGITLHRVRRRVAGGRGDGALVRVSTPLRAGERAEARSRLADFARRLDRALDGAWPREVPAGVAGAAGLP